MPRAPQTVVDLLHAGAEARGDATWLRYLRSGDVDGPCVDQSYAALLHQASAVAALLQEQGANAGDRALMLFPSGVEFLSALFGCQLAGVIPVPAYPPDPSKPERALAKLRGIAASCRPRFALTTAEFLPLLAGIAPSFPELAELRCVATNAHDGSLAERFRPPQVSPDTVALLQYTSGSTGEPKGVVLRHRHLIAQAQSIREAMGDVGVIVGWLPVFHDMGLGNVLHVLHATSKLVLMSPEAFLKRPARWLEAISRHRGRTCGGPNFAYDLCVRRVTEEELARLDLKSWEVAFCGAEPVRESTFQRFSERFAPSGFRPTSFYPCYGLAEATLFVAGSQRGSLPKSTTVRASALERGEVVSCSAGDADARTLVSCGKPSSTEEVRIVDPASATPLGEGAVGEIWVRGPAIASGYWGREEESLATFGAHLATGAGPFLRTGDMGFLREGELYVAGRLKDVIIIAGRNLYPQDLEAGVEAAVSAIRKGCCAAFSVEQGGEERLVIVAEQMGTEPQADVVRAIKRTIAEQHQVGAYAVVLLEKGTIPKTSSGKLERYACRNIYLESTRNDN